MALTRIPTLGIEDGAVDNTKLDLTSNYAFTGNITGTGQDFLGGGIISTDTSSVDVTWTAGDYSAIELRLGGITDTYDRSICMQIYRGGSLVSGSVYRAMTRGISNENDTGKCPWRENNVDRAKIMTPVQTDSERTNHGSSMSRVWIQHNIATSRPYFTLIAMGGKGGGYDTTAYGGGVCDIGNTGSGYISGIRLLGESGTNISYLEYAVYGMTRASGTLTAS